MVSGGKLSDAEIREAAKSLEAASESGDKDTVLDLLERLKKNVLATENLLKNTKIGIAVGKLRTSQHKAIADLAKSTVKKWKSDVVGANSSSGSKSVSTPGSTTTPPVEQPQQKSKPSPEKSEVENGDDAKESTLVSRKPRTIESDKVKVSVTFDKTRDSCIGLIYDALGVDGPTYESSHILEKAVLIEKEVHKVSKFQVDQSYRNKIRSLRVNLRDEDNPGLRGQILSGQLSAARLCSMTPQEMASEQRKAEDKKLHEQNLLAAQGAKQIKAMTDRFQCGKCKQRKVSYYQMQTRSADEPMTSMFFNLFILNIISILTMCK